LVKRICYLCRESADRAWQAKQPADLYGHIEAKGGGENEYEDES